jgi:hypothetical protein
MLMGIAGTQRKEERKKEKQQKRKFQEFVTSAMFLVRFVHHMYLPMSMKMLKYPQTLLRTDHYSL